MQCEKCGKEEACVHFTEVKQKQKEEIHLCSKCAKNYQQYITKPSLSYSMTDWLGGLVKAAVSRSKEEDSNLKCDKCKMNFYDFQNKGLLGCANDYTVFRDKLKKLFDRVHNASHHTGKIPKAFKNQIELTSLQKKLKKAVDKEEYEKAAEYRDKIKLLEQNQKKQKKKKKRKKK